MIRVVIYDDNPSRRESLSLLLSIQGIEVVGMFPNCSEVVKQMEELEPHVVLMDIGMPHTDGIEGVKLIKENYPDVKVIMQTVFEEDEKIFDALRFGADGYILKKADGSKIIEAIHDVTKGGSAMTASVTERVLYFFRDANAPKPNKYELSEREKQILQLLVAGNSYKMIGDKLGISFHTVNSHLKKIYEKLKVHSQAEAVTKALRERLI